jgi:uncharacterized OB-fold protein
MHCRRCGRTAVPVQDFGCESCGAHDTDLERIDLSGDGTVLALVTVHYHPDPVLKPPFTLASVQLAEGPVVRALLRGGDLRVGVPVRADTVDGRLAFTAQPVVKEARA